MFSVSPELLSSVLPRFQPTAIFFTASVAVSNSVFCARQVAEAMMASRMIDSSFLIQFIPFQEVFVNN